MFKNDSYIDFNKKKEEVRGAIWLRYNYFIREVDGENNYNKIITYYKIEKDKLLKTIDVSQNKYFD